MKLNKKAFTIPELLIFITIVGVISVAMFTIIKPNEKYLKFAYYNAYDVLATSAYNIKEDARDLADSDSSETPKEKAEDKVFPGANINPSTDTQGSKDAAKELCKKLALNFADTNVDNEEKYGYINTSEYNCGANFKSLNANTDYYAESTWSDSNMAFRATNSMRFFISELTSRYVRDPMQNNTLVLLKYFVVWVDLNGDRRPNTIRWTFKKPADIVPFVVMTSGTVVPSGPPTLDPRYLTARVQYPSDSALKYSPRSMPLYEAQKAAYNGKYLPTYDLMSLSSAFSTGKFLPVTEDFKSAEITAVSKYKEDERCKYNSGEPSICAVVIDETRKR